MGGSRDTAGDDAPSKTMADAIGDLEGLKRAIARSGLDAIVIATPENVRYAGDVHIPTQRNIRHRPAYIVWPASEDPVFVIAGSEQGRVARGSWIRETRHYEEFGKTPMQALAEVLAERGLARGRIGCELEFVPAASVAELQGRLDALRIESCDAMLRRARMLKTPREIAVLRDAAAATAKAILATFATARIGEDERSLVRRLSGHIMESGAERVPFVHVYGGPNAGLPHLGPTSRALAPGDLVKADAGGAHESYLSNVGRTAIVGRPEPELAKAWELLRGVHAQVIEMLRPGVTGRDVFAAADECYRRAGLWLRHPNNGHGIGLEVHERPIIGPHEDIAYEPRMVTTVETRCSISPVASFHIEDLVVIGEHGAEPVATAFPNDELFVI